MHTLPHRGTEDRAPVLVLGSSLTVLGVVRACARRGIPAYVVSDQRDIETRSRWYQPLALADDAVPEPSRLRALLEHLPFERAVLMPCTDSWSRAVAALDPTWAARFPSSTPSAAALDTLTDKGRLAQALRRLGIHHPRTVLLRDARDLNRLPDDVLVGSFLKPRDSEAFFQRYRRKAMRVRDRAETVAKVTAYTKAGFAMLLQEYLPGPATSHYFVDGFVDRRGRVLAHFARQRLRMWPPDFGNSSFHVSVPLGDVSRAVSELDRLLGHLRYRGIFNAEFMRDERTNQFYLLEVNARPWWYIEFAASCGVDVCNLAYRDALGEPVDSIARYREGQRNAYRFLDWHA